MNEDVILIKIKEIFARNLELPLEKINDNLSRNIESRWDSVTNLKIIADIESEWNIEFSPKQLRMFTTVQEVVKMVQYILVEN